MTLLTIYKQKSLLMFRNLLLILLVFTSLASAQSSGTITGIVRDATTKEPLIGANVIIVNTSMGAATNTDGYFEIRAVPLGTYSVRALVIGYSPVTKTDIVINPVKPVKLDFSLVQTALELDELTVKPDYFSEAPNKPISTRTQSNEEIRRLPGGFEDVVRAISILPGVAQAQSGRNDLIIRGGAPSENLYVIDGLEVPNINHFNTQGASGGALSFLNLDYVKNTTFSSGGFGVRYGDKLSSVLSINLKDGRNDQIGGKTTISATQFGLDMEGPLNKNDSFVFSARRSYLDFIFKAAGFGFVPEYWDFLSKVNIRLGPNDKLNIIGIGAIDKTKFFYDTEEQKYDNSKIMGSSQNQLIAGISWQHVFRNGFVTTTLGQTIYDFNYQQNDILQQSLFKNNALEHESILTENIVYKLSSTTDINAGLQGKMIRVDNEIDLVPFIDDYGQLISASIDFNTTSYKTAGWFELSQKFNRFDFRLGGRFDYFNLLENKTALSPRFSTQYSLTNLTNLNFSIGQYHQAPAYIWILANDFNRTLRFISVNQYIVGLEHLLRDDLQIIIEAYIKDYSHYPVSLTRPYLVMANTGAGYGGSENGFAEFGLDPLVSSGVGKAKGIEISIQKKLSDIPLYGIFSLSYNHSNFTALDGISRPGSYDQRWIANLGGGYIFNEKWEMSTKFRYATGRPYTPFNDDFSKSSNLYNTARIPDNHSLDIRIERKWYKKNIMLITYIDVQNVYNRPPYDVPRYNNYKNEFDNNASIGLLPSIGISAEF